MNSDEGWITHIRWSADGLIPAVAQDASNGQLLMVAWMNQEALRQTVRQGHAVYWSRSRKQLWCKGEQSGHQQLIREIRLDCDNDVLLLKVEQQGGIACHTGRRSCFFQRLEDGAWKTVEPVLVEPDKIYRSD